MNPSSPVSFLKLFPIKGFPLVSNTFVSRFWPSLGVWAFYCGLVFNASFSSGSALADSIGGWGGGYNRYEDYYPPGFSHYPVWGRAKSGIVSIDLDPQNLLNSSLRVASREGRVSDVVQLLKKGAEVDGCSESGETALMLAARRCSMQLTDVLLLNGANINASDQDGRTPLIFAARESCIPVVSLLLRQPGIDLAAQDEAKKTAYDYAVENSLLEVGGPSQKIMSLIINRESHRQVNLGQVNESHPASRQASSTAHHALNRESKTKLKKKVI